MTQVRAQIKGNKVRVQLEGTNYLHLAEVKVIDTAGNNVAYQKNASLSTGTLAYLGVDGSTETFFHSSWEDRKCFTKYHSIALTNLTLVFYFP